MGAPIATLRDNFEDNSLANTWQAFTSGSATIAETGQELRITLPSSTAGAHSGVVRSNSRYDLTGDSFDVNIDTMVSTSVAATAAWTLQIDSDNRLLWRQVGGTLTAETTIGGVTTVRYTVAWNASTYKYLRIREASGNVLWESSSNGTSWTTRATVSAPFAVSDLEIVFNASCGNVASPGSFRIEDVNLIRPALTTNWRWTQVVWPLFERTKTISLAIDTAGTVQGYIVTADGVDVNGAPSGNVRYWSGPADGGRVLTEQPNQAAAEAMAVNYPLDGRFDLPSTIEARCFRMYHRSIDGASYTLREVYPRRLVQSDDMEAETIKTLHLAAGVVTADKISVQSLAAITANIGSAVISDWLTIGTSGGIYQGSGTPGSPTTGLKLWNVGGIGKLAGYNGGTEQFAIDTDGRLKAGGGNVVLSADGAVITVSSNENYGDAAQSLRFRTAGGEYIGQLRGRRYEWQAGAFSADVQLRSSSESATRSSIIMRADANHNEKVAEVVIGAYRNTGSSGAEIRLLDDGYDTLSREISLLASFVTTNARMTIGNGLLIGSPSGTPSAGQIWAASTIVSDNQVQSRGSNAGLVFFDRTLNYGNMWYAAGGSVFLRNLNTPADILTISAAGDLTVGRNLTVPGGGRISVNGTSDSAQHWIRVKAQTDNSSDFGIIYKMADDVTNNFQVLGNGTGFLRAAAWTYGSDERWKENIVDLESCLDALLALRPRRFDYINGEKNQIGFVAQEVEPILPELVQVVDEAGHLGLRTTNLIPMLVQALQELVASYRDDIADIRSQLEALTA